MTSFTPLCANTLLGPDCARLDHIRLQTPSLGLGLCVDVLYRCRSILDSFGFILACCALCSVQCA